MRRTAIAVAALLAIAATPARAAVKPQIVDPSGDANFTWRDEPTAPVSIPWFDITTVRWWADTKAQHASLTVLDADPSMPAQYFVSAYDGGSYGASLNWYTDESFATITGPMPRQGVRKIPAPVWSGDTLTFTIPLRSLPRWFAAGRVMTKFRALTGEANDVGPVRALTPGADVAEVTGRYVVGS